MYSDPPDRGVSSLRTRNALMVSCLGAALETRVSAYRLTMKRIIAQTNASLVAATRS